MTKEEAIEKVREMKLSPGKDAELIIALHTLIPELRESEDERIRKSLIELVEQFMTDERKEKTLIYLEKQKEQNLQGVYVDCTEHPEWYGMPPKEQKPAEWSEEDEDVFNDILLDMGDRREMFKSKGETTFAENTQKKIDWLNSHHLQLKYSYCPQPEQEWSDRDKEMLEFVLGLLDNLVWRRDWEISKAECLEWLVKSLNPTKKEWSEDDEKMRINILNALTPQLVYSSGKGTYTGTSTYKYDDEIKWLKSLSPSWKPSEKQMKHLHYALTPGSAFDLNILNELYEQLKKL